MNPEQVSPPSLDRLQDIILPTAISWWPLSTGAWLVIALALLWLASGLLLWWRVYRRNAYRRAALRGLDGIRADLQAGEAQTAVVARLGELLKRTALGGFPRQEVAMLSGDPWLEFLTRTGTTQDFKGTAGQTLIAATFNPNAAPVSQADCEHLLTLAHTWITDHRVHTASPSPQARKPASPRQTQ